MAPAELAGLVEPGQRNVAKRWLILGCALAVQIAVAAVATSLPVLLPLVKAEFNLTFGQAALVVNFSFFGTFFALILAGWFVDEFGERWVLVIGCISVGLAAIACSFAPLFAIILALVLVMGVGMATPTPAGSAAVRSAFPLRLRGTVMGVRQAGFPLGGFLAALLLPMIAIVHGWRIALMLAGIGAVIVGIACFVLYPMPRGRRPDESPQRASLSMRPIFGNGVLLVGLGGALLVMGQFILITFVIAFLIHDRHVSIATAGFVLAIAQLTGAIGRVAWGVVSDRFLRGNRKLSLVLAAATGAVGSLGLAILSDYAPLPVIVIVIVICAFGILGWNGVLVSFLSETANPGAEGRTVASGLMLTQPGIVIGPFLFGLVVDSTQSFRLAWLLLAAVLGVAILIMSRVPNRRPAF